MIDPGAVCKQMLANLRACPDSLASWAAVYVLEEVIRRGTGDGFHFPARAFTVPMVTSVNKMREEFTEFLTALTSESREAQVEELWDLIQTMEQHMRDYAAEGVDVFAARERVENKCRQRGLYGEVMR